MVDRLQRDLNILQALPLMGPFVFSPIKALVSKAQMIAGVAMGIFYSAYATYAHSRGMPNSAERYQMSADMAFDSAFEGGLHFLYAFANFVTIGVVGCAIELLKRRKMTII